MNIYTTKPENLTEGEVRSLNTLVAAGFEHEEDEQHMLQDTKNHLEAAQDVQIAVEGETPVAMAMYRRCLWRLST